MALPAEPAFPAGERVRLSHHAIADLPARHALAKLGDDPGELVAERHRRPVGELIVSDMYVGAADGCGLDLDLHPTGFRLRLGNLSQFDVSYALCDLLKCKHRVLSTSEVLICRDSLVTRA